MMLAGVSPLESAWTGLLDAVGAVLAAPVDALVTLPPWDNSAMDGYAVRSADVTDASPSHPVRLPVIGEVAAGHAPSTVVAEGTAVRILTGAIVPTGADAVVPVEETDAPAGVADRPDVVSIHRPAATGAHVRPTGGDVRQGERVMQA
ncbi:MAG: molybdopterin molybdenumtransferase MoeA, partial [Chloroflexi bacterium]|nr:molybdopterin molybdenumtransferase MoeA [Chloroflexota bacterium]